MDAIKSTEPKRSVSGIPVNLIGCLITTWFCLTASSFAKIQAEDDFQLVTERYVDYLIANNTHSKIDRGLFERLNADGQWPDVEYTSDRRSDWPAVVHLMRTKQLALMSRSEQASNLERTEFRFAAKRAADTWFTLRSNGTISLPPNNYWRVSGEPSLTRDCLLLLDEEIREDTRREMVKTLSRVELRDKGANLMQQADVVLHFGAYTRDGGLVANAAQSIASEIKITGGEGIKSDFSYHQHGPRLQSFHYGKSYFSIAVRLAWQLRGTRWAISGRRVGILSDLALEGFRWMSRGKATPPSTLDRAATRQGALLSADVSRELELLASLSPRSRELKQYLDSLRHSNGFPVGHRFFPESDFVVYHQPDFSFFLKTVSAKTRLSESLNGENLLGDFMNWGDHYLIRDGSEYAGLQPVWDWKRLPGLTAGEDMGSRKYVDVKRMSGTISTGFNGLTAFEGHLSGKQGAKQLHFRKSWFCHNGVVVALVSDLRFRGASGGMVTTSIEQCRLKGGTTVGFSDGHRESLQQQPMKELAGVKWIHHNRVAYVPIGKSELYLSTEPRSGSWRRVNKQYASTPVTESVFSLGFEHHQNEDREAYGYAIVPSVELDEIDALMLRKQWQICSHSGKSHAIWFDSSNWMVVFFEATELSLPNKTFAKVNAPCLMVFRDKVLYVSRSLPDTQSLSVNVTDFGSRVLRFLPGQTIRRLRL
ncbi:MAG: polysaccharide lyase family 8 super-sandwich domain-containing protein [Planctomycetota bacterium]